ncbi:MAG: DNA-processing protein DprA [Candidatus Krumholzibacteria bacterium]|nr:DNA-processing protein DprA [Candidatus Krumholzibacteria bacterium]
MFENYQAALALVVVGAPECLDLSLDAEELFALLQDTGGRDRLTALIGKRVGPVDWRAFDAQRDAVARTGTRCLCPRDPEYPEALREVAQPPALLFCKGDVERLRVRGVAVVGTRKPSPGGVAFAKRLARDLSAAGVTVVSGLARGIDTAAHSGALGLPGTTVAVIGTGLDVPYPAENAALMMEIAAEGCVVSEQLMGMHAAAHVFPRRNRMISALAHAVVVVEGGLRSGALITARWALEQGRDVGAVPGFPGDFRAQGPNHLIRQGGFLVEGAGDVFDAVPLLRPEPVAGGEERASEDDDAPPGAQAVLAALSRSGAPVDEIAAHTGLAVADVQRHLLELELAGLAESDAAGRYARPQGA